MDMVSALKYLQNKDIVGGIGLPISTKKNINIFILRSYIRLYGRDDGIVDFDYVSENETEPLTISNIDNFEQLMNDAIQKEMTRPGFSGCLAGPYPGNRDTPNHPKR